MPKKLEEKEKEKVSKKAVEKKGKATENKKKTVSKVEETKPIKTTRKTVAKKVAETKKTSDIVIKRRKTKAETDTKTKTKTTTKVAKTAKKEKKVDFLQEYYDLPYRYNETIVTILAQTPKKLFVYWDISDKDRETYQKAFGNDFFEKTYPVLLVHNEDMNYTFEVPINDFANSWYIDIQDSKKNYVVQLGRKFKNLEQIKNTDFTVVNEEHINLQNDFVYITDSNKLEAPNDHILFELLANKVKYRNVKTGEEFLRDLKDLANDLKNLYPLDIAQELYTKLYADEIANEDFGRRNPASGEFGLPTSSGALRSSGLW